MSGTNLGAAGSVMLRVVKLSIAAAIGLAVVGGALISTAMAQTAPAPDTTVDFTPIVNGVVATAGAALLALATWIGWYVKNWVASKVDLSTTQLDEQLQQMYNEAAARSIAYAESAVKGVVPKEVDVRSAFVATAAEYLLKFWPDLVGKLGLTPEKIRDTIIARLPSGVMTEKADAIVVAKAAGSAAEAKK